MSMIWNSAAIAGRFTRIGREAKRSEQSTRKRFVARR